VARQAAWHGRWGGRAQTPALKGRFAGRAAKPVTLQAMDEAIADEASLRHVRGKP